MGECRRCGVAYDVGLNRCIEIDCARTAPVPASPRYTRLTKIDPIQSRFTGARSRSKRMGLEFDLTIEFITQLLKLPCVYCLELGTPQMDRRDNGIGYTQDNVVPACKRCNTVKSMYLSYDQMMIVAEALGWRR